MALVEGYKALSDESRLRILALLSKASLNVQELTSVLGLSQSTVSHHLRTLLRAGMITSRKQGTWSYYTLVSDPAHPIQERLLTEFLELIQYRNGDGLSERASSDKKAVDNLLNERRDRAREYFETVANEWETLRSEAQSSADYLDTLSQAVKPEESLLELGCGSGAFLRRVLPRPGKTIGVDYSPAMLEAAKQSVQGASTNVELRLGFLEHLPVADSSIDAAVAYMVFRHIAEPREVLKDVSRVLRPGGRLTVVDLTPHQDEERKARFAEIWMGFSPDEFASWGSSEGFCQPQTKLLGEQQNVFLLTLTKKGITNE